MEAHGEDLRLVTKDDKLVHQIKKNYQTVDIPLKIKALLDFSVKVTKTPAKIQSKDIDKLKKIGIGDEEILETVHITGYFNYINRVADALGCELEEDMKKPAH